MNKKLILGTVGVVAIFIAGFILLAQPLKTPQQNTPAADTAESQAPANQPAAPAEAGPYREYSEKAVQETTGSKLLFFYASWCPQCRQLDESIKGGQVPDGVTIFKVDYDKAQALRQKYAVTIQTTVVKIDNNGNLLARYVAYDTPNLQAVIDHLF